MYRDVHKASPYWVACGQNKYRYRIKSLQGARGGGLGSPPLFLRRKFNKQGNRRVCLCVILVFSVRCASMG